ncbi:MAG TPA: thiamine-phosphate kinase [Nitrosopumilaceae archaeon]|nr:thiamine-phosphate kinase [Nitrosopumilaceae archaeon]
MSKLNENDIIKIFQKKIGDKQFVSEDVETFKVGKTTFVAKTDTLVESTDIPAKMKIHFAARKSVVACVSDFASKGVKPLFGIVSVTIPKKFSKKKIEDIANGLGQASREFGFRILGGDTNEGKELVIQVSIFGVTDKIIPRRGAKVGDLIFTSGPFGYTAAGLMILQNQKRYSKKFSDKALNSFLKPRPKMRFGLSNRNNCSSSMDSSDGLAITLHEMSKQSSKRFNITSLPANQDLVDFAKKHSVNLLDLIFKGGEEYEIVFTAPQKNRQKIMRLAKMQNIPLKEIGYISKGKGVVYHKEKKSIKIKNIGWRHFSK